jgi:hypothetical protein
MKLLLSRDQTGSALFSLVPLRIGSGVIFTLQAELELDAEETALLQKYNFTNSALVVSDPIEDLKAAFRPALFLGIVTFVFFAIFMSWGNAFTLGVLVILVMTIVYFRTLREQIIVNDLLAGGRKFRCDSVVALIDKEAYLENICAYLRQVLESAKNWGDREAIPIAPLSKEEAKRAVLTRRA